MSPFWKSLAFWKAAAYVIAAIVLYFKPDSVITDVTLLALVQAAFQLIGVPLELKSRGLK